MIRFILSDLRRLWAGSLVVVLLVALATALGVSVVLQERALRLGSARAADKFDLVIGAGGSGRSSCCPLSSCSPRRCR